MQMQKLFATLDESADGKIDIDEFGRILKDHPTMKAWLASMQLDLNHWTLDSIFWLIDKDKDGFITMEELCEGVAYLKGPAKSLDLASWFHSLRTELTHGEHAKDRHPIKPRHSWGGTRASSVG